MLRLGFDLDLGSHEHRLHDRGWRAMFLHHDRVNHPWAGQVGRFYATPGEAVRDAAWTSLNARAPRAP